MIHENAVFLALLVFIHIKTSDKKKEIDKSYNR